MPSSIDSSLQLDPKGLSQLAHDIKQWGKELGFAEVRISDTDLSKAEVFFKEWLANDYHGEMKYLENHGDKRYRPAELVANTLRVISVRLNYLPASTEKNWQKIEFKRLEDPLQANISLYARGRDYHKVLKHGLNRLAQKIQAEHPELQYRVFTDSAPVMEVALAQKSGLGWRGKHTLLLHREAGSMFFIGDIYVNLALPVDEAIANHCGQCHACMDVCPTQAIIAPYILDARRCISYLTIEHKGSIPVELRPLIGNRIYGCDDCQLICPWNKFAQMSPLKDFAVRPILYETKLIELFAWSEQDFSRYLHGSAIYRIGHTQWLRNIAVALGNALRSQTLVSAQREDVLRALHARIEYPSSILKEHVLWAISTQNFH